MDSSTSDQDTSTKSLKFVEKILLSKLVKKENPKQSWISLKPHGKQTKRLWEKAT